MKFKNKVSLLLLIASSILFNTQCVSLTKSLIYHFSKGQAIVRLFEQNYQGERNNEPSIKILKNSNENSENKEILFIISGFASNPNRLRNITNPNSVLGIASKYFQGDILIADYLIKDSTHFSWSNDSEIINFILSTLKNGEVSLNSLEKKVKKL